MTDHVHAYDEAIGGCACGMGALYHATRTRIRGVPVPDVTIWEDDSREEKNRKLDIANGGSGRQHIDIS